MNHIVIDATKDLTFVNARGVISSVAGVDLVNVPGPYSWYLSIEENFGVVTGGIRTLQFVIEIQNTRDRAETLAVIASSEMLSKFPRVD